MLDRKRTSHPPRSFLHHLSELLDELMRGPLPASEILNQMKLETMILLPFIAEDDCARIVDYLVEGRRSSSPKLDPESNSDIRSVMPFPFEGGDDDNVVGEIRRQNSYLKTAPHDRDIA